MRVIKGKKKKRNIILKVAVLAVCVYVITILINQQIQISEKKSELDELNKQITMQNIKNKEIEDIANSASNENETYIEQIVRESLGFAKKGERVFINIAGN